MKRMSWFAGIVLAAAIVGGVAWRFTTKSAEANQLAQSQQARKGSAAQVETATAGPAAIMDGLTLVGTLESPSIVNLSPKQANKILTVNAREGDDVVPGQALVTLDPSVVDAQVLDQQSVVSGARSRLAQSSVAQGSTTTGIETTISQRQADVQSARAEHEQAVQTKNARLAADQEGIVDAEAKVSQAQSGENAAQAKLNSAIASLANARVVSDRQKKLYDQGYVSLQDLQSAQTQVTLQENLVESARQDLEAARSGVNSAKAQLSAVRQTVKVNQKVIDASVATAFARLNQAQAALKGAVANRSQTQAYKESVSALQSDVNSAKAQLRGVQAQKADLVLRSPIEGVVTARNANPGDLATPGQPVLTLQYLDWLFVTVAAPVDQSPNIKVGQFVDLTLDAFPNQKFRAPVEKVNPFADSQTRQFTFRVRLENSSRRFRPGMYARVKIATKQVEAKVTVPREALKDGAVFVLKDDGTLERRVVKTGLEDSSRIEVLSGLDAGEKVVSLSYAPLKDGQKAKSGRS